MVRGRERGGEGGEEGKRGKEGYLCLYHAWSLLSHINNSM